MGQTDRYKEELTDRQIYRYRDLMYLSWSMPGSYQDLWFYFGVYKKNVVMFYIRN